MLEMTTLDIVDIKNKINKKRKITWIVLFVIDFGAEKVTLPYHMATQFNKSQTYLHYEPHFFAP